MSSSYQMQNNSRLKERLKNGPDETVSRQQISGAGKEFTLAAIQNYRGRAIRIQEERGDGRIVIVPVELVPALQKKLTEMVNLLGPGEPAQMAPGPKMMVARQLLREVWTPGT